jgi:hypothetical protein
MAKKRAGSQNANDTPPSSLMDSNVSPSYTKWKNEELGYATWLVAF